MDALVFCTLSVILFSFLIFTSLCNYGSAQRKGRHAAAPPGPPSLPILGHLHLLKTPLHRSLAALSASYGPILSLRFGSRPVVLISSPPLVEECFTRNDIALANRPKLLAGKQLGFDYSSLAWSPYGPHWRNLRRIAATEILSSHRIQMFSGVRRDEIRDLIKELYRGTELRKVNLKTKFSELSLNLMMRIIAGKRYYGERVVDLEESRRFREIVEETLLLSGAANVLDYLPLLRWIGYKGVERRMIEVVKRRDLLFQNLIDEQREKRRSAIGDRTMMNRTLIDVLLNLRETQPDCYSTDLIKGITIGLLTAGTDTTSVTLEWAMSHLLNHPQSIMKAKAEIDLHVGRDRLIDDSDLDKLPYLQCIISETLRLQPAGPLLIPHISSEDLTVGGFGVPAGTMLLVNAWAIHRDPNLWHDSISFKPERFEGSGQKDEGLNFKYIPFGYGRRSCPGTNLALKVLGLTLGTLIQCFHWERVGVEPVDMEEGSGLTMPKAQPLEAMYRPYDDMIDLILEL